MPIENRQIIFRPQELMEALEDFRTKRADLLPDGEILGIEINGPELFATLRIASRTGETVRALPSETIAAALILYCIKYKIPLPERATKALQKFGASVGLVMTSY